MNLPAKGKRFIFWIFIPIFLFAFSFQTNCVLANYEDLQASVTIINPLGPDVFITAVPEKRIPNVLDRVYNRGTYAILKIYPAESLRIDDNLIGSYIATTTDQGTYFLNIENLAPGNYDFTLKGYSHLIRLLANVVIEYYANLDFTNQGLNPLISGDVNLTDGDNKINALDVSVLVNSWNTDNLRADLNQDTKVNAIDMSNLLNNFNQVGD